jgi:hypothetical protein
MTRATWVYCSTTFVADRISGGYGITRDGILVYSSYDWADVLQVARQRFGYGAAPLP